MKHSWIAGLSAALLVVATAGASGAQTQLSILAATLLEPNQKTAEVSTDELKLILATGSAVVFDARPPMEYAISHIPGARNVGQKPDTPTSLYISDVAEIERQVPDRSAALVLYCNGPFCGKSKRLAEELLTAGYTNVRRYQLGAPTWRALVGTMQIELEGVHYVLDADRTAWLIDGRPADQVAAATVPGARNVPATEVVAAKDDGRLPMEDHNTRIVVVGADATQARQVADLVAANAFHNVTFYAGSVEDLMALTANSAR